MAREAVIQTREQVTPTPEDLARAKVVEELWTTGALLCELCGNEGAAREKEKQRRISAGGHICPGHFLPAEGDGRSEERIMETQINDVVGQLARVLNEGLSPTTLQHNGLPGAGIIQLRRYRGPSSPLSYRYADEGVVVYVFLDPSLPVFDPEKLDWEDIEPLPYVSDGVLLRGMVPPDQIRGITADIYTISSGAFNPIRAKLQEYAIPLYTHDGQCLWPQQNR